MARAAADSSDPKSIHPVVTLLMRVVRSEYHAAVLIAVLCGVIVVMAGSGAVVVWKWHGIYDATVEQAAAAAVAPQVPRIDEHERQIADLAQRLSAAATQTADIGQRVDVHERQLQEIRSTLGELKGTAQSTEKSVNALRDDERRWHAR